jgi:GABA(A) receptor-associated protein
MSFKTMVSFEERLNETKRIMGKHPDRLPIICERAINASKECPYIDKRKYLVPNDLTVGQFVYVIRKRLKIPGEKALFLFINGIIPSTSVLLSHIYDCYKDEDGYLYVTYTYENTFG